MLTSEIWDESTRKLMEVRDLLANNDFYLTVRGLLYVIDDDDDPEPWEDDSLNSYCSMVAAYQRPLPATGHSITFRRANDGDGDLIRIDDDAGRFKLTLRYRQAELPVGESGSPRWDHQFRPRSFEGDVDEFRRFVIWSKLSGDWDD